jgi:hypothetical protein
VPVASDYGPNSTSGGGGFGGDSGKRESKRNCGGPFATRKGDGARKSLRVYAVVDLTCDSDHGEAATSESPSKKRVHDSDDDAYILPGYFQRGERGGGALTREDLLEMTGSKDSGTSHDDSVLSSATYRCCASDLPSPFRPLALAAAACCCNC